MSRYKEIRKVGGGGLCEHCVWRLYFLECIHQLNYGWVVVLTISSYCMSFVSGRGLASCPRLELFGDVPASGTAHGRGGVVAEEVSFPHDSAVLINARRKRVCNRLGPALACPAQLLVLVLCPRASRLHGVTASSPASRVCTHWVRRSGRPVM